MDQLTHYRQLIQDVLTDLTLVPFAHGDISIETLFDTKADRYAVLTVGWDQQERVFGILAQVDLIDGKFWIQRDGTEESIPVMLMARGIPKQHIVIAYHPVSFRKYMDFAIS